MYKWDKPLSWVSWDSPYLISTANHIYGIAVNNHYEITRITLNHYDITWSESNWTTTIIVDEHESKSQWNHITHKMNSITLKSPRNQNSQWNSFEITMKSPLHDSGRRSPNPSHPGAPARVRGSLVCPAWASDLAQSVGCPWSAQGVEKCCGKWSHLCCFIPLNMVDFAHSSWISVKKLWTKQF